MRVTHNSFNVRSIKDGQLNSFPTPCETLAEARELATRRAAMSNRPLTIVELDFRQRIEEYADERNAIIIEVVRIENMTKRIFE